MITVFARVNARDRVSRYRRTERDCIVHYARDPRRKIRCWEKSREKRQFELRELLVSREQHNPKLLRVTCSLPLFRSLIYNNKNRTRRDIAVSANEYKPVARTKRLSRPSRIEKYHAAKLLYVVVARVQIHRRGGRYDRKRRPRHRRRRRRRRRSPLDRGNFSVVPPSPLDRADNFLSPPADPRVAAGVRGVFII